MPSFRHIKETSKNVADTTFNPLGDNPTKWSDTLKEFLGNLPTNCLSVFDHFVGLTLKGLKNNFSGSERRPIICKMFFNSMLAIQIDGATIKEGEKIPVEECQLVNMKITLKNQHG